MSIAAKAAWIIERNSARELNLGSLAEACGVSRSHLAHAFAAAFLMPERDILSELPSTVDWQILFELKRRWQVSLAALLMRARTLKKISEPQYLAAVKAASARGWRRAEPVPLGEPEQPRLFPKLLRTRETRAVLARLPRNAVEALGAATSA